MTMSRNSLTSSNLRKVSGDGYTEPDCIVIGCDTITCKSIGGGGSRTPVRGIRLTAIYVCSVSLILSASPLKRTPTRRPDRLISFG